MKPNITPKSTEVPLSDSDLIVSKTDTHGRIVYGNRTFMRISGYSLKQMLGVQHNIVRHPDMPRGVFRLLWKTIQARRECFVYVKNLCADGSFYWVWANITPDIDAGGSVRGYFSVRRRPEPEAIRAIQPLYREMLNIERGAPVAAAPDASLRFLESKLAELGTDYERFILGLKRGKA